MQRITPNQALLQRLSTKCFAYMTSGKITNSTDVSRVAELLSEDLSYWKDKMIILLEDWTLLKDTSEALQYFPDDFHPISSA